MQHAAITCTTDGDGELDDLRLAELATYRPEIPEPADFDEFWDRTLAENPFDPASVQRTPCPQTLAPVQTVTVTDLTFGGYGGDPVKAWFIVPSNATGPLPTVVEFNGYNSGRSMPTDRLGWASAGFAYLCMDNRGQGGGMGGRGSTPDPHGTGATSMGFMTRGIETPENYYYRRLFVDAHHAVEAVATLAEVDAERIAVYGGSQGGVLTIAAASLNHRVIAAMPDVPFLSHIREAIKLTAEEPYAEIPRYLSSHRDMRDTVYRTLSYFDTTVLGRRAVAPAHFSVGLMDGVCPPSTVFAAANWYGGEAQMRVYEYNGHEGGQTQQWAEQVLWLRTLLGVTN